MPSSLSDHNSLMMYDNFAKTFAHSREGMRWSEIDDLLQRVHQHFPTRTPLRIADIGCGSGRLLDQMMSVS